MTDYEAWLDEVRKHLESIDMPMDAWQKVYPFDFDAEYMVNTSPTEAARKANKHYWEQQGQGEEAS